MPQSQEVKPRKFRQEPRGSAAWTGAGERFVTEKAAARMAAKTKNFLKNVFIDKSVVNLFYSNIYFRKNQVILG